MPYFTTLIDGHNCGSVPFSIYPDGVTFEDGSYGVWDYFFVRTGLEEVTEYVNHIDCEIHCALTEGAAFGQFEAFGRTVQWWIEDLPMMETLD